MKHEESRIQQNCVKWFRYQYPEPKYLIYANANGGYRSKIESMIMKGEGVKSGIPDLTILTPGKILFIEMKSEKGKLTDNQTAVIELLKSMAISVEVCRSFDEFQIICKKHLTFSF